MQAKKLFAELLIIFSIDIALLDSTLYMSTIVASEPDITNPGPDTASFPAGPFNLPKGRAYYENFPLTFEVPETSAMPSIYNWPFLLRVAMTDSVEFRLSGQGFTSTAGNTCTTKIIGFNPLNIGIKCHLWGTPDWFLAPSAGIELYLTAPLASRTFNKGTQFIINMIFGHNFSHDLTLEWNLGLYSYTPLYKHTRKVYTILDWALQKKLSSSLAFFLEGFYQSPQRSLKPANLLLGAGFISYLTRRICIFGSYDWTVFNRVHGDLIAVGFAVAF